VSGQHHAPAALYPRRKTPGTHWPGGWVDPRAGLGTEASWRRSFRSIVKLHITNKQTLNLNSTVQCFGALSQRPHRRLHLLFFIYSVRPNVRTLCLLSLNTNIHIWPGANPQTKGCSERMAVLWYNKGNKLSRYAIQAPRGIAPTHSWPRQYMWVCD
jgi:hypothetical protein